MLVLEMVSGLETKCVPQWKTTVHWTEYAGALAANVMEILGAKTLTEKAPCHH